MSYSKGEMNYFSGTKPARGYYLRVTPVTVEKREGFTSTAFTMFSGVSTLIEEAKAFSAKRLEALAAVALSNPKLPALKETVLVKSALTVVAPVSA